MSWVFILIVYLEMIFVQVYILVDKFKYIECTVILLHVC